MLYTKDILAQPIPGILDITTSTIKTNFTNKYQAFQTALFPEPPVAPEVNLTRYIASPD